MEVSTALEAVVFAEVADLKAAVMALTVSAEAHAPGQMAEACRNR